MTENIPCPVCSIPAEAMPLVTPVRTIICPACGDFQASLGALHQIKYVREQTPQAAAKLRHWLRKAQDSSSPPRLLTEMVDRIASSDLPRPLQQADNFVRWLGRQISYPGVDLTVESDLVMAIMGAGGVDGYLYVLEHMHVSDLIQWKNRDHSNRDVPGPFNGTLTVTGWSHFDRLQREAPHSRSVFMAMKYKDPLLDRVYKECLKPAVSRAGLELTRLDEIPEPGLIDNRLRASIRDSVMLIADLTHNNAGAYWEAGYAEGLGRPVLYTCNEAFFRKLAPFQNSGGCHFDTNHHLTILWKEDELEHAAAEVTASITLALPELVSTPIAGSGSPSEEGSPPGMG